MSCRGCLVTEALQSCQGLKVLEAPPDTGNAGFSHMRSSVPMKLWPAMDQVIKLKYQYLCCGASSDDFFNYLSASRRARDLPPFL